MAAQIAVHEAASSRQGAIRSFSKIAIAQSLGLTTYQKNNFLSPLNTPQLPYKEPEIDGLPKKNYIPTQHPSIARNKAPD